MTRSWSSDGALVDHPTRPYALPIDAAAVSPRSFGAFLPPPDRGIVAALADGQGVLGATSAALRGLGPGAELAFQGGARIRIADVLPDELVGAAELLVSKETGATIGVHRERYLLLQPRDGGSVTSTELRARLRPLLPADLGIYRRVQVRAPGETPYFRSGDAVLPPVMVKTLFGEFAARPSPGRPGYLDIDPAWVRTHIVTVQRAAARPGHVQPGARPPAPRRDVVARPPRTRRAGRVLRRLLRAEVREPRPDGDALPPRVGHRVRLQLRRGTRTASRRTRTRGSCGRWSASASSGAARSSSPTATTSSTGGRPPRRLGWKHVASSTGLKSASDVAPLDRRAAPTLGMPARRIDVCTRPTLSRRPVAQRLASGSSRSTGTSPP